MIHMETVRLTASQALVRFLENQYISYIDMDGNEQEHKFVKGIFMLPGHGNVVGFANGVEQELKDMIVYQGKNEQGMALAAVGYAKQMRRKSIFACTSSVGPGACNMVTAAATATANNIPVLILPGDIRTRFSSRWSSRRTCPSPLMMLSRLLPSTGAASTVRSRL